jgi:hypothetical protein
MLKQFVVTTALAATVAAVVSAQTQSDRADEAEQVRARQRISTMEAVLAQSVQNGADMVLRQVSNVMPDRPMLSGPPQVRGFRLDGYGVFFHVQVPTLVLPITWPIRQLVQESENRAASLTLQRMFAEVSRLDGQQADRLQQLIRELQLQLDAANPRARTGRVAAATVAALPAAGPGQQASPAPGGVDPRVVDDPHAAYTEEVKNALINAMLENSQGLAIAPDEWLVIAARDDAPRSPLLLGGTIDFSTWIMRVRGSDLAALRTGSITVADARTRVEVREE